MSKNKAESSESQVFKFYLLQEKTEHVKQNSFARLYCFLQFISVHFRYIYNTNVINGQGVVRGCKSSTEICIFTELPWLGRPIVEAEVRTCFS